MTPKCVCSSTAGCRTVPKTKVLGGRHRSPGGKNGLTAGLILSAAALASLLVLPGQAAAQAIVVDINVVGEPNENQTEGERQLRGFCFNETVAEDLPVARAASEQRVCELVGNLDPSTPAGARRLQEIADAVAPEEVFALNDSLVALSDYQTTNVHSRLNALRSTFTGNAEGTDSDTPELTPEEVSQLGSTQLTGGGASSDLVSRLGGFVNGHISSGDIDGETFQQDSDVSSNSLTFGGDYRFNDNVIFGVGVGFLQDDASFNRVAGGAESDGFNITAFATWYEADQGYVDIVLDLGRVDHKLERSVAIFPEDSPLIATASPSSSATSLTASAGRNFKPFDWDLTGYARLSLTRGNIDSYRESLETPQEGFAPLFSVGKQSVVSTTMTFGLELTKPINTSRAVLIPLFRLEFVRENDRKKDDIEATLISTGDVGRYKGEDRVGGYSNLGIGASAVFSGGRTAYAYYETHLQHDLITQNWLKAGVRLEF